MKEVKSCMEEASSSVLCAPYRRETHFLFLFFFFFWGQKIHYTLHMCLWRKSAKSFPLNNSISTLQIYILIHLYKCTKSETCVCVCVCCLQETFQLEAIFGMKFKRSVFMFVFLYKYIQNVYVCMCVQFKGKSCCYVQKYKRVRTCISFSRFLFFIFFFFFGYNKINTFSDNMYVLNIF